MLREISSAVEHLVYTEIVTSSILVSPIMKKKKIKEELAEVKGMLEHVICQMQNMQSRIDQLDQDSMLWVSEYDDSSSGQSIGGWSESSGVVEL